MSSGQKRFDSLSSSRLRPSTKGYCSTTLASDPSVLFTERLSASHANTTRMWSSVGMEGLPRCCMYRPVATFEMQMSASSCLRPSSSLRNVTARSKSRSSSSCVIPERAASFGSSMIWVRMSNSLWSTSFPNFLIMALLVLKSFLTRSVRPRRSIEHCFPPRQRLEATPAAASNMAAKGGMDAPLKGTRNVERAGATSAFRSVPCHVERLCGEPPAGARTEKAEGQAQRENVATSSHHHGARFDLMAEHLADDVPTAAWSRAA
mmetsp:Transcript_65712/g.182938  ORF Transcript_65712/g.182938 Transcript_65712/m.182938 type:complete len:263 (+) Transcript_65712:200-988(+)